MSKDMMSLDKALELLKIERKCVLRQNGKGCQRDYTNTCNECDLVQPDADIVQMYDTVIELVSNYIDAQNSVKEWAGCI